MIGTLNNLWLADFFLQLFFLKQNVSERYKYWKLLQNYIYLNEQPWKSMTINFPIRKNKPINKELKRYKIEKLFKISLWGVLIRKWVNIKKVSLARTARGWEGIIIKNKLQKRENIIHELHTVAKTVFKNLMYLLSTQRVTKKKALHLQRKTKKIQKKISVFQSNISFMLWCLFSM